jgi:hypothetical protein
MLFQENTTQRFGEHVGQHVGYWDMNQIDFIPLVTFANKMVSSVDVLCPRVVLRIFSQCFGPLIIDMKRDCGVGVKMEFGKNVT